MDMNINISLVKSERDKRGWTQSHLAEVCDLSLRTIQRIEKLGVVSHESIKSLASVFELSVEKLTDVELKQSISPNTDVSVWENKSFFWLGTTGFIITAIIHMLISFTLQSETYYINHSIWFALYAMWGVFLFSGKPKGIFKAATCNKPIKRD